jgi:hypothetical protein
VEDAGGQGVVQQRGAGSRVALVADQESSERPRAGLDRCPAGG